MGLRSFIALLLISAAACMQVSAEGPYEDWYPADITPPAGTQYPCALTALPRGLPGIPAGDRRFVNHVYSAVLKATQAKLVLLSALHGSDASALFRMAKDDPAMPSLRDLRIWGSSPRHSRAGLPHAALGG